MLLKEQQVRETKLHAEHKVYTNELKKAQLELETAQVQHDGALKVYFYLLF